MSESKNYTNNLDSFLTRMKGSFVEKVTFYIDSRSTFDKAATPFSFHYCFSIVFTTDKGNYSLRTAMTNSGIDTFWIEPVESLESGGLIKSIQSNVIAVSCKNGYNDLAYRICIRFEDSVIIIFAAEIYDSEDDNYDYKLNDEMLLAFDNEIEAENFEAEANYA